MTGIILIVDDNPDNLKVLEDILVTDGHRVRAAVNGEVALRAVAACLPDLILLDIMMPGMDGFEVCRRLKNDPSTASIPILFLSALAYTEDKIKAFDAGGLDYITKPFAEKEVLSRVRTHLKLAAAQEEMQKANRKLAEEIQARKRVEKALKESEERYRAVVEDQTEAISRFTPDGTITFVNDYYCRYFGKARQELIGSNWSPESAPDDIQRIEEKLCTLSPSNPVITQERRIYTHTGEERWMQFVNRGLFDATGRLLEIQSVGRDITDLKRAANSS